ncbi:MAG: universal stress protein [Gemmatimonadota bacterium]
MSEEPGPVAVAGGPVLLATRFEPEAAASARVAALLADGLDRELVVLYVAVEMDTAPLVASHAGLEEDAVEADILARLEERAREHATDWFPGRRFEVVVGRGPVVDTILDHVEDRDACFLVVGHHEHGPLARLFGVDPAHDLLERSSRPVVVVPLE